MPMDLAKHSPTKSWKHFKGKGKPVVIAALDRWMAQLDKLLILPRSDDYADSQFTLLNNVLLALLH